MLSLGIRLIALSAETNPDAVAVAQANFPNLVHVGDVKTVCSSMFYEVVRRRNIRGIIAGGGSPCQGNSSLNNGRRSPLDPRSQMPTELRRLLRELASDEITNQIQMASWKMWRPWKGKLQKFFRNSCSAILSTSQLIASDR